MSVNHYENFPVGSLVLPRRLRRPVHAVYAFARTADDIADEGDAADETRLHGLQALRAELERIGAGQTPDTALMRRLQDEALRPFALPLAPFYDLLDAFAQDVVQKRYADYAALADYACRSANPVGRLMLHLYGQADPVSLQQSDSICTALQLINFWQDIAIDWQKGRVYLPQDEMARFGVNEQQLADGRCNDTFRELMAFQCRRAHDLLDKGEPLGHSLRGRIGFELRLIAAGGRTVLHKLAAAEYDVFRRRPVLGKRDWLRLLWQAA
ncbi:MAG: squalene synthase HpnC [Conchiformibius sp.]|nr:squalene synthase HpnC [Conchiformibius sp.]